MRSFKIPPGVWQPGAAVAPGKSRSNDAAWHLESLYGGYFQPGGSWEKKIADDYFLENLFSKIDSSGSGLAIRFLTSPISV
jgi:hypothetical protein